MKVLLHEKINAYKHKLIAGLFSCNLPCLLDRWIHYSTFRTTGNNSTLHKARQIWYVIKSFADEFVWLFSAIVSLLLIFVDIIIILAIIVVVFTISFKPLGWVVQSRVKITKGWWQIWIQIWKHPCKLSSSGSLQLDDWML